MIIFLLLVILNIFMAYVGIPYIAYLVRGLNKNNLMVFVSGILVYVIGIQIAQPALQAIVKTIFDYSNDKTVYSVVTGTLMGLATSAVRFEAVRFLRKNRCASRNLRACIVFGLGEGYALYINLIGKPGFYYLKFIFRGTYNAEISDILYILNQMAEVAFTIAISVGLTALMQYGFTTRQKLKYFLIIAFTSSFVKMQIYFVPYVLKWPNIITNTIVLLVTIQVCILGYEKIRFVEK